MATLLSPIRLDLDPVNAAEVGHVDYRLPEFVLAPANENIKAADIAGTITASGMTLSIEEANSFTLAVQDTERHLLRSNILTEWAWGKNADDRDEAHWVLQGRRISATIGDLDLRLVKVTKAEDTLTLTFEEEAVQKLRAKTGPKRATRFDTGGGVTRAQFVRMLAKDVGVPAKIPEEDRKPEIAKSEQKLTATEKRADGEKGIDPSASLQIKGKRATRTQLSNCERGLDVSERLKAPELAMVALIAAYINESTALDLSYGDSSSVGILQLLDIHYGGSVEKRRDIERVTKDFLREGFAGKSPGGAIGLARRNPGMPPEQIAALCEGAAAGSATYAPWVGEARRIVRAYKPGFSSASGGSVSVDVVKPFEFSVGKKETYWDAIVRLAGEVQWRAFVRKGVLWYASDEWLFSQKPQLALREKQGGVHNIDCDVDLGARDGVSEATVTALARRWTAQPGMAVSTRGMGPADGRWIVASTEKDSLNTEESEVTVGIRKPLPEKPEPAAEVEQQTFDLGGVGGQQFTGVQGSGALRAAYATYLAAKSISEVHTSYVFGGGHVADMRQLSRRSHFDCSSSTSYALFLAGLVGPHDMRASGAFSSWGEAGQGKYMTIWYHSGHVFIEFKLPGMPHKRFDTSQHGGSGPMLVLWGTRSTAGFRTRRWSK